MLYFAYGSNMDFEQMRRRCRSAIVLSKAVLHGHKLAFTRYSEKRGCGVADSVQSDGEFVEGVLYEISEDDAIGLDECEGVKSGDYSRIDVRITLPAGEVIETFTYKATEEGEFRPSKAYMQHLITGARYHCLSPEYVAMLEAIETDG